VDENEYKQMVMHSFDNASLGYDCEASRFFDNSATHLIELLQLSGHENVLDVATGTGKSALLMASRLRNGHVTGVDLSEGMLRRAKLKAQESGLTNVTFKLMDFSQMNFPANHFAHVQTGAYHKRLIYLYLQLE